MLTYIKLSGPLSRDEIDEWWHDMTPNEAEIFQGIYLFANGSWQDDKHDVRQTGTPSGNCFLIDSHHDFKSFEQFVISLKMENFTSMSSYVFERGGEIGLNQMVFPVPVFPRI